MHNAHAVKIWRNMTFLPRWYEKKPRNFIIFILKKFLEFHEKLILLSIIIIINFSLQKSEDL